MFPPSNLFNLTPDAQCVPAPYLSDFLNGITAPGELELGAADGLGLLDGERAETKVGTAWEEVSSSNGRPTCAARPRATTPPGGSC